MKKVELIFLLLIIPFKNASAQTATQIDNEATFTRLYGYVRYFYPGDEAAAIDWDKFAIYGVKKVADCKNQKQLALMLKELFTPIAPVVQIVDEKDRQPFNLSSIQPKDTAGYKTIAWQHIGAGTILDKRSYYRSARTNRSITYPSTQLKFGSLAQSFDASPYLGKEFKITAKVKLINGSGTGHLWARVDKTDRTIGFFDNMNNRPINLNKWATYTISGKIDSNASRLVVGVFMQDVGEIGVDDFSVSVNINGKWQGIYFNKPESQQAGVASTGFSTGGLQGQPSSDYVYSTSHNANDTVQKYISIKSKFLSSSEIVQHSLFFNEYPKVGECINKDIGSGLKVNIPLALYGTPQHTYPVADSLKLSKLLNSLNGIKINAGGSPDLNTRLAAIIISWNIFQHFFPYFDFAKTDWGQDLKIALNEAYQDNDGNDFQRTLEKMTAKLKDGHIVVDRTGDINTHILPIKWEWIQGKLIITKILDPSITLRQGDIITNINGRPSEDYFTDAEQYISAATPGHLNYRAQYSTLVGPSGSSVVVTTQDSANIKKTVNLNRSMTLKNYNAQTATKDTIRMINNYVTYLNVTTTPIKSIKRHLDQLQNSKVIICDLRGYPYDQSPFIQYLLTKPDTTKWMFTPHIIYPDQEKIAGFDREGADLKPLDPHISSKVIFIIDSRDISAAESFMSFIEYYKLATIIGQPTAGTNGVGNRMYLPGGYSIQFTGGMKVTKLDGSQQHGVGTKPDIFVEKTIKGVKEGRDEFLDKAVELANDYVK